MFGPTLYSIGTLLPPPSGLSLPDKTGDGLRHHRGEINDSRSNRNLYSSYSYLFSVQVHIKVKVGSEKSITEV